jgi:hypothetical protein
MFKNMKIGMRLALGFSIMVALLPLSSLFAVGGISNKKLIVLGADPVDYNAFEFEPTIGMIRQTYRFNQYGDRTDIPDDNEHWFCRFYL